jgi:hypothetical protein
MKIHIVEAVKSAPDSPCFVWRVFRDGREVAMGVCPGERSLAEAEAAAAAEVAKRRKPPCGPGVHFSEYLGNW